MLVKVSVNVSTFIFILVIIIIDRREVRDEYPSFFLCPLVLEFYIHVPLVMTYTKKGSSSFLALWC